MYEKNAVIRTALTTVLSARHFILLAVLIYCAAAVAGWVFAGELGFLKLQFAELVKKFQDLNPIEFMARIFIHNLIASYLAMCFVVLFGIIPFCLALFNGLIIGWFAGWMDHLSWMEMAVMLIPHGIFEWPAMFIAFGTGMWRGMGHFFAPDGLTWGQRWKMANCAYFTFVVPLLFVAAIIESRYHFIAFLS